MKKTFLGLLALCAGLFLLAGCSSSSSTEIKDGTYYNVINTSNTNRVLVTEEQTAVISGTKLTVDDTVYVLDYEKDTATSGSDVYYFEVEDDILTLGDEHYVLAGSETYKEILKLSEAGKSYDFGD